MLDLHPSSTVSNKPMEITDNTDTPIDSVGGAFIIEELIISLKKSSNTALGLDGFTFKTIITENS